MRLLDTRRGGNRSNIGNTSTGAFAADGRLNARSWVAGREQYVVRIWTRYRAHVILDVTGLVIYGESPVAAAATPRRAALSRPALVRKARRLVER